MSDSSQGEGWWIASDGKWYPPEQHPDAAAPAPAYEPPPHPGYQSPPQQTLPQPSFPQQGYQQPGMPPPPSQPPLNVMKPKRAWWKIALAVVLGGILLIGGCTLVVLRLASGPIDASNDFLALIKANDLSGAAAMLDASCGGTIDELRQVFPVEVESYNLTSTSVNSNNGQSSGEASGSITFAGDESRSIRFTLNKSGDDWQVCSVRLGS